MFSKSVKREELSKYAFSDMEAPLNVLTSCVFETPGLDVPTLLISFTSKNTEYGRK